MKKRYENKIIAYVIITIFLASCFFTGMSAYGDENEDEVTLTIYLNSYEIIDKEDGQEVIAENFGRLLVPGKPILPSKIFSIALPPGIEIVEVNYDINEAVTLPGIYDILPTPLPEVIGEIDPYISECDNKMFEKNFDKTYGNDDPYPSSNVEFVRTAHYRKYNLVDVRVTPFTYYPLSGNLEYYPKIDVIVSYRYPENPENELDDYLIRTERTAERIIANYDQAQGWYQSKPSDDRGLHDFVIITLDSLVSSVTPLVNWETSKGRTVEVVTTTWIDTNYNGYDLAEKMRNFLRDKYPSGEWGIEDVLLVGHYDQVPMRRCWQDTGYGKPETDYYYAELSLPDNQSWDADGDHKYGENSDPIDFYAEVNVGRIPWSDPSTVLHICDKSVAYEQNSDPSFKKNILLLGAYFWSDTDNAVLMELKANQPWMSDWNKTCMYEQPQSSYPSDYNLDYNNVKSVWSSGTYAFVNWAGHGSASACYEYYPSQAFVNTNTCPYLNDDYPAIIFADACSNSDTDYLNIGQAMLKQGAVGFLGATKVAYGYHGWDDPYDGAASSMDYFFTTCVTSGNYTQGAAHQWSLIEMYINGLWYYPRYETFEWGALWGNPDLGMLPTTIDTPPEILNVNYNPYIQNGDMWVNIDCHVFDFIGGGVNLVKINITYPDGSSINQTMSLLPGHSALTDVYYYNTTYQDQGTYSFFIWANDTYNNQKITENYTFEIVTPYITDLSYGWNFMSTPFCHPIDKTELIVNYSGVDYTWTEATAPSNGPIVDPNIYGWDRSQDMYFAVSNALDPGYGYWIYAYSDCELRTPGINAPSDPHITNLKEKWNSMGIPRKQVENIADLIVNYNGSDYTWADATDPANGPIIDPNIYGWDRSLDMYFSVTALEPGYAYWMYAYYDCTLNKLIT